MVEVLPVQQLGEHKVERQLRLQQECPRHLGWSEHETLYYHVYNRTGVCCVMAFMPRGELYKHIGSFHG